MVKIKVKKKGQRQGQDQSLRSKLMGRGGYRLAHPGGGKPPPHCLPHSVVACRYAPGVFQVKN